VTKLISSYARVITLATFEGDKNPKLFSLLEKNYGLTPLEITRSRIKYTKQASSILFRGSSIAVLRTIANPVYLKQHLEKALKSNYKDEFSDFQFTAMSTILSASLSSLLMPLNVIEMKYLGTPKYTPTLKELLANRHAFSELQRGLTVKMHSTEHLKAMLKDMSRLYKPYFPSLCRDIPSSILMYVISDVVYYFRTPC